jgi:RNA polymerase sigma-70 factor (ECF subfamily)
MKPMSTSGFIAMSMDRPVLESEAFEQIVEQHRALVLRFVFASVRDMDLAETLTQDCLWKACKSRAMFRGDCSIQTWLIRIALNLIRDHARNRRFQFWKRAESVGGEEMQQWPDRRISPEDKAAVNEQVQNVWEATKTLSERQRTVFLLRYVEDLDISEIADATGLTPSTVNVHLIRALRSIRKRLGDPK